MSKIIMTQPLCAAGYEPLAKEGEIYVANNSNPSDYLDKLADAECIVVRIGHMNRAEMEAAPNLIISPHSAAQTREATIRAATMCAEGCIAVMHGERWPAVANPEAYNHPRWMR